MISRAGAQEFMLEQPHGAESEARSDPRRAATAAIALTNCLQLGVDFDLFFLSLC
jgi:hypothetical protein